MAKIKNFLLWPLRKSPLITFYITLGFLVILIIIGQFITNPSETSNSNQLTPRSVSTFNTNDPIYIPLAAQVTNQRLITLNSQTQGLITKINIKEGQKIKRGQTLISIGSTNLGGNPATISRQITQTNLEFQKNNQPLQSDILNLQRKLTDLNKDFSNNNRDLSNQTLTETKNLFDDTQNIYNQINDQLDILLSDPATASSSASLQQTKLGLQSNLNQLSQAIRSTELQANENKPPAQITNTNQELSQKQLDLQSKSQDLNLTLTQLNLELARLNEALFYPASPIDGIVQLIHVNPNQTISPGMPIASILSHQNTPQKITVPIPLSIAPYIDISNPAIINHNKLQLTAPILYLSVIPDQNNLYSAILTTDQDPTNPLPANITINFRLKSDQFIPLDSLYQTSTDSYIYLLKPSDQGYIAAKQIVSPSQIIGNYILITGLNRPNTIITSRYVTDQSPVIPIN